MNKLTYHSQDGYQIPDLQMPEEPEILLGRYARMHGAYLKEHRKVVYLNLLTSGKLHQHLQETEQTALQRLERITRQMAREQGISEALKEADPLEWTRQMNNIRSRAEEGILQELIYR